MIILPTHTVHALQPLDVSYFMLFKTTFRKVKDATMAKKKMELNKITFVRWVDQVLNHALTKYKIVWI
jgi:hypothetical protein